MLVINVDTNTTNPNVPWGMTRVSIVGDGNGPTPRGTGVAFMFQQYPGGNEELIVGELSCNTMSPPYAQERPDIIVRRIGECLRYPSEVIDRRARELLESGQLQHVVRAYAEAQLLKAAEG